ncbi:MAG: hypothetical protein WC679_01490 [Bacteroidales bacterium]|jgi:hypothetical protein
MTINQLKKALTKAGFDLSKVYAFEKNGIELGAGGDEERFDEDESYAAVEEFRALGYNWGGFKTGYNSWILRADYVAHEGDWNDTSSTHHY